LKQIVKDRFVGLQTYQGKISPGGQCLPGIQRFFVTVDGKFFTCERVDEESSELCIGDLKNGFDLENAKKILNVAKITEKECRECWCYKMCSQCVAKAGENGKIEAANHLRKLLSRNVIIFNESAEKICDSFTDTKDSPSKDYRQRSEEQIESSKETSVILKDAHEITNFWR